MPLTIRRATTEDAPHIRDVHVASIRGVCAKDYSPEQIEAWAGPKRAEHYAKVIAEGQPIFVAEIGGGIVGFAELHGSELQALYVHPDGIGKGAGRALLSVVEEHLVANNEPLLRLNSTITSIGFYESMGCERVGQTIHRLGNNVPIPCIAMRKQLPGASDSRRMIIDDLGTIGYQEAWDYQVRVHERVVNGGAEEILIVEHPPVITLGRRGDVSGSVVASNELLESRGVNVIHTDRGGDVTFHGPGQVVIYPIIRLIDHKLSVGGFVHRLEDAVITFLKELVIEGHKDKDAVGVWTGNPPQKVCALGVRIRKGVSMHGIALNVETDLSYFDLIVPCGLQGKAATSLRKIMGEATPSMPEVKNRLASAVASALT
jgi:lipoate-protein ligase B